MSIFHGRPLFSYGANPLSFQQVNVNIDINNGKKHIGADIKTHQYFLRGNLRK